jgi:hypothetical protein
VRDVPDRARVGGDVFPLSAVATGGGRDKAAALVSQTQREAVDFGLRCEDERRVLLPLQEAPDAGHELPDILVRKAVGEREHRHPMPHLGELLRDLCADFAGQALGALEFGEAFLDGFVAAAQCIVLRIRDRRRVLLVIAPVVLSDLGTQRFVLRMSLVGSEVGDGSIARGIGFRHRALGISVSGVF